MDKYRTLGPLICLLIAAPAFADAVPANKFAKSGGGDCYQVVIGEGKLCKYSFTTAANSAKIDIRGSSASICLNTDITSAVEGSARVKVRHMQMDDVGTDAGSGVMLGVELTGVYPARCIYNAPYGSYYIEVTVAPTPSEVAQVTIEAD